MIFKRIYFWWYIRIKYGFHFKKTFYFFRVLKNILKAKYYLLTGQKKFVLRGIDFAVTYRCNFNCDHCYAKKLSDSNRDIMTIEDYKRVRREAVELGCIGFSMQGGEVFRRIAWEGAIKAIQPHYNHPLLTTNGSVITEALDT